MTTDSYSAGIPADQPEPPLDPRPAWEAARNAASRRVDWRFTTADARIKLKHLYPAIQG